VKKIIRNALALILFFAAGAAIIYGYASYDDCRCNQGSPGIDIPTRCCPYNYAGYGVSDNDPNCCSYPKAWVAAQHQCLTPCANVTCKSPTPYKAAGITWDERGPSLTGNNCCTSTASCTNSPAPAFTRSLYTTTSGPGPNCPKCPGCDPTDPTGADCYACDLCATSAGAGQNCLQVWREPAYNTAATSTQSLQCATSNPANNVCENCNTSLPMCPNANSYNMVASTICNNFCGSTVGDKSCYVAPYASYCGGSFAVTIVTCSCNKQWVNWRNIACC